MGTEEIKKDADASNWQSHLAYDQWLALPVSGSRPPARYKLDTLIFNKIYKEGNMLSLAPFSPLWFKHAAVVVDENLYIVGGSRNGRYLSDVQVFDFRNLLWSTIKLNANSNNFEDSGLQEVVPPTSSHNLVKWGNKLLLLGGNSKKLSDKIIVWFIDLETHLWRHGDFRKSSAHAGQSSTLVGSRLIMFGGEDRSRKLLNDVNVLDLETMTWDVMETLQTPPAPRFDHTAAVHAERYLLIFGGCSHASFFNDLHVLDLQTASVAKLETLVSVSTDKLELRVYGFNDKLPALLSKILKTTKSFMPISDRFMVIKEGMERKLKKTNVKPLSHSTYLRVQVLFQRLYDVDEKLHILSGLSISDVKSFIPQLWSKVYIEGNLSQKEAIRLSDIFKTNFGVQPLPIELMRSEQCICLPPSANLIRDVSVKNKSETNSLQIERELRIESLRLRALIDLFNEIVEEPLFNQLRTKEQLGYTFHCGPWVTCNIFGFYFCVQSAEYNPIYLQGTVENFINRLEELLQ